MKPMLEKPKRWLGWGLLGLLLFFILINLGMVPVNCFFIAEVRMPVAFVVIFSALIGAGAVHFLKFLRKAKRDPK